MFKCAVTVGNEHHERDEGYQHTCCRDRKSEGGVRAGTTVSAAAQETRSERGERTVDGGAPGEARPRERVPLMRCRTDETLGRQLCMFGYKANHGTGTSRFW